MTDRTANRDDLSPLTTALLGAAAGAFGVWALDRLDWWMWRNEDSRATAETVAARPNGEPPAETLVTRASRTAGIRLSPESHELASQLVHYSIGIAPAVAYALFRDRLPGQGASRGALFGLGLFGAQDEVLNTVTSLGAKPQNYPWQAHARGLLAHTLYGIATELALNAAERALEPRDDLSGGSGRLAESVTRVEARRREATVREREAQTI